jgi:hypothetical protein
LRQAQSFKRKLCSAQYGMSRTDGPVVAEDWPASGSRPLQAQIHPASRSIRLVVVSEKLSTSRLEQLFPVKGERFSGASTLSSPSIRYRAAFLPAVEIRAAHILNPTQQAMQLRAWLNRSITRPLSLFLRIRNIDRPHIVRQRPDSHASRVWPSAGIFNHVPLFGGNARSVSLGDSAKPASTSLALTSAPSKVKRTRGVYPDRCPQSPSRPPALDELG